MKVCVETGFNRFCNFGERRVKTELVKNALLMLIKSHSDDKIKLAMQMILRDESFRDGYDYFDFDRFRNVLLVSSQKSMNEII